MRNEQFLHNSVCFGGWLCYMKCKTQGWEKVWVCDGWLFARWLSVCLQMDGWLAVCLQMDGWLAVCLQMDGWLDGCLSADGWLAGCLSVCRWMDGWMAVCRWMDVCLQLDGWLAGFLQMDGWLAGCLQMDGWMAVCSKYICEVIQITDYTRNCNIFIIFHARYRNKSVLYRMAWNIS